MLLVEQKRNSFCRSIKGGACSLFGEGTLSHDLCPSVGSDCMVTDGGKKNYCCPAGMKVHQDATEQDIFCHSETAGKCQLKGSTRELCPTVPQCTKVKGVKHCCPVGMRREKDYNSGDVYCHSKVGGECQITGTERELCSTTVMQCITLGKSLGQGLGPNVEHCCPAGMRQVITDPMQDRGGSRIDTHYIHCHSKESGECQLKGDTARELCSTAQECTKYLGNHWCCPAAMRLEMDKRGNTIHCRSKDAGECQLHGSPHGSTREPCDTVLRFDSKKAKPSQKYELAANGDFYHYEYGRQCLVATNVAEFIVAASPTSAGLVYYSTEKNGHYFLYELRKSQPARAGYCPKVKKRILSADFSRFHMPRSINQFLVEQNNLKLSELKDEL
jgi:hypothetical protein